MRGQTAGSGVVTAGEVTAVRALDLDDPGAEVGELPGGERGGDGLLDGDDGDAVQGEGVSAHGNRTYRVRNNFVIPRC